MQDANLLGLEVVNDVLGHDAAVDAVVGADAEEPGIALVGELDGGAGDQRRNAGLLIMARRPGCECCGRGRAGAMTLSLIALLTALTVPWVVELVS